MVTLHSYILRDLLKTFGLALVGITAILVLGGGLYNVIRHEGITAADVVMALPTLVPLMVTIAMPMAALFAAALTYGRLAADNELTACRAAGINIHRLFLPVMLLSLFVTLFMTFSVNYVMPALYKEIVNYGRANVRDLAYQQLRQRGYVRHGSDDSTQHLLTARGVDEPSAEQLVEAGYERPQSRLSYFKIDSPTYLQVDAAGNMVRFITADSGLAQFDTRQDKVLVTTYVSNGLNYEEKRATRLEGQRVGPIELPIEFPVKTSMVDLNTLLAWQHDPASPPEVREAAAGFLERLRLRSFAEHAVAVLRDKGTLELSGADRRTVKITCDAAVLGDKGPELTGADVQLTDAAHPDGVLYKAGKANIAAKLLGGKDTLVSIKLISVEEKPAVQAGRRGRSEPARRHDDVFIDGLRIPESVLAKLASLTARDVIDAGWSPPPGLGLEEPRASVIKTASNLSRKVEANLHFRLSAAASALVTILLGAILGIMLRGSRALVAIGVAAAVVIVVFVVIIMGKTLTENVRTTHIGPYVTWGVIGLTGIVNLCLMRLGVRR